MALTAVITEPGETTWFAGYTYFRVDGYASTLDASLHEIVDYLWSDGEGHTLNGPIASFRYDTAGTKTITLTVTDSAGATSVATLSKTYTTWSGTTIYVATAGNDSTGLGTIGSPYQTPDKAFTVAAPLVAQGAPVRVLFNQGDVLNSSGGTYPAPLLIDSYGSGVRPKIRVAAGQTLYGETGIAYRNNWGYAVISKNVDYDWAVTGSFKVGATSKGSAFINCKITNGLLEGSDGNSDPTKLTWDNVEVSGKDASAGGGGMGISNSGGVGAGLVTYLSVLNSYVHGNSPGIATNVYVHGTKTEVRASTFDGENNGVQSAFFSSGMQKYCIIDCLAKNAHEGFGCGSNGSTDGSAEAQDCWFERNRIQNCTVDGLDLQYTNRGIVKNNIIESSTIGILLNHTSGHPTERTQNVRVYNNVIYAPGNQGLMTDGVRTIDIQNNIIYRTTAVVRGGDQKFMQIGFVGGDGTTDDHLYVTIDKNHYYSSAGDTSTTLGAFIGAGSDDAFTDWQAEGFDVNGVFGTDPLFGNPAGHDFTIAAGSPCRNTGAPEPMVYRDFLGFVRSTADSQIDKGAYEYGANSGDTTPPTVSITSPANSANVSGTITVQATASDNVGVVGVQFKLDGVNLGAEDLTAPYSVVWDTTTAMNGAHALTAVARDAAANSTTSTTVNVTVNNASPPVLGSRSPLVAIGAMQKEVYIPGSRIGHALFG